MNKRNIVSLTDAFMALEEDDLVIENESKNLQEGKQFSVNDSAAMEEAQKFMEADSNEDDTVLEVIDADANTLDQIKDGKSYVGKMLLQCNACKATKFVSPDDLMPNAEDSELYNEADECPHCHAKGPGYSIAGQVGAKPNEQPQLDNTEAAPEDASFENDEPEDSEVDVADLTDSETEPVETDTEMSAEETNTSEDDDDVKIPDLGESWNRDQNLFESFDVDDLHLSDYDLELINELAGDYMANLDDPKVVLSLRDQLEDTLGLNEFEVGQVLISYLQVDPDIVHSLPSNLLEAEDEGFKYNVNDLEQKELDTAEIEVAVDQYVDDNGNVTEDLDMGSWEGSVADLVDVISYEGSSVNIKVFNKNGNEIDQFNSDDIPFKVKSEMIDTFNMDDNFVTIEAHHNDSVEENSTTIGSLFANYRADEHSNTTFNVVVEETETEVTDIDELLTQFGNCVIDLIECKNLNIFIQESDLETDVVEKEDEFANESLAKKIITANNLKLNRVSNPNASEYFIYESLRYNEDLDRLYDYFVKEQSKSLIAEFKQATGYKTANDLMLEQLGINSSEYADFLAYKEALEQKDESNIYKSVTDRKELAEALSKLNKTGQNYHIQKSINEGYRYDIILDESIEEELEAEGYEKINLDEEDEPINSLSTDVNIPVEVAPEGEIIDAPEASETTDVVPAGMSQEDIDVVNKIMRISSDIAEAINQNYNIEADPRKICADIIQDLQLVGGAKAVEDLEDTPINNLTAQMYQEFNGFFDNLENAVSVFTGQPIRISQAQRMGQAIKSLDSPNFSRENIFRGIESPRFLQAAQQGLVSYIDPEQLRLENN